MDTPLKRFESPPKGRLDQDAQVLPAAPMVKQPMTSSSPIADTGKSILNFLKSIPDRATQVIQGLLDSEEEGSSGTEASSESPDNARILDSQQREIIIEQPVYPMPTLFHIQNNAGVSVYLIAVLTAPYKPKRYGLQPGDSMMIMAPDAAEFELLVVRLSREDAASEARYTFRDDLYMRLLILKHHMIPNQLCICKKT